MWNKSWDEAIGKTCLELGYEEWHADMHDREIDQVVRTKNRFEAKFPLKVHLEDGFMITSLFQ